MGKTREQLGNDEAASVVLLRKEILCIPFLLMLFRFADRLAVETK